ncbi:BTAD domain-containing putative transcriptional regulator [Actinoplanes sp. NPDC051411]|uniref:AfsR/SARP family transcriptional regulator n=1 Tax=Actinoplanes sp. NPDC051411 TaxID=3155522 RepID=UPI00342D507D
MAPEAGPPVVRFRVLGLIRAWRGDVELDLGPRQRQLILALLLVADGRPVDLADFVALLWAGEPPPSAVNVVHRYIGGLRRLLEPELPNRATGRWLQRHGAGYRLDAAGASLDLRQARTFAAEARQLAATGDVAAAVAGYARALKLWDGRCGAGLDGAAGVHPAFVAVDREGSALARAAADAALSAGLCPVVLPALRRAAERDPFDEALQARLLLGLAADGRQAEALTGYQTVRRRLAEELGIEPGPDLIQAHRRILDQQFAVVTPVPPEPATVIEPLPVPPAQLPTDLAGFAGRRAELAQLDAILDAAEQDGGTAVAVIDGMPGVGKSTLAVHWAHRAADRFPDGQLFLDLRGFDADGTPTSPFDALGSLLTGLGVAAGRLPAGLDARAGLYRSLLSGRRILVVLDNAIAAGQAAALLPASPGCAAVVTSRHRLTELTLRGARALTADLPGLDDARDSLRARIGDQRASAEPQALDEIIARCGRLPLAIAVVGARAHGNPEFSLTAIAAELRAAPNPLDALHDIFSWSYRSLSEPAARLLRLLSLHVGGEITTAAAASLAGLPPRRARELTAELTQGRLLLERQPGRYVLHDLIHAYAAGLARDREPAAERDAALARLLTHYALTAQHARDWLGTPPPGPADTPSAGEVTAEPIGSYDAAVRTLARISSIVAGRIRRAPGDA